MLRVLGARHLLQAIAIATHPTPRLLGAGSAVDAAHASSAALLAVLDRRQRWPALLECAVASALTAAGLYSAYSATADRAAPPNRDRP